MSVEGLSGLVNRITAWADRMQREHGVLGFPYAVVKKYGDDEGGRQAALITYYGFLSVFPLLLLGVAVLSRVLADHPDLRQRLITAIVPQALRSTVEHSLATLPTSTIPLVAGLIGLLFSGTGVVFSAYQTLNHVAAVRHRSRASFLSRYVRVFAVLATLMAGALATGALTVVATAVPGQPAVQRAAAVLGSALVVFAVLLLGAKLLLARPAPVQALWPGAIIGAAAVTVVLNAGPPLLARLVAKAGPVYGSFATVAGMFALLYLIGQALVYAAEVAAVRHARLWPRALDLNRPTAADARALALLAREQERIPAARIEFHLAARGTPPVPGDSPPANDGPRVTRPARPVPLEYSIGCLARVLLKIVCLLSCRVLGLAVLISRADRAKNAELLVLRHQHAVLRRYRCICAPSFPDPLWVTVRINHPREGDGTCSAATHTGSTHEPAGCVSRCRRPGNPGSFFMSHSPAAGVRSFWRAFLSRRRCSRAAVSSRAWSVASPRPSATGWECSPRGSGVLSPTGTPGVRCAGPGAPSSSARLSCSRFSSGSGSTGSMRSAS